MEAVKTLEEEKLELISWVAKLQDRDTVHKMLKLKEEVANDPKGVRKFGDGKHLFGYIADDFNAPLEDFEEYMK